MAAAVEEVAEEAEKEGRIRRQGGETWPLQALGLIGIASER
jgi:hypothetical protein